MTKTNSTRETLTMSRKFGIVGLCLLFALAVMVSGVSACVSEYCGGANTSIVFNGGSCSTGHFNGTGAGQAHWGAGLSGSGAFISQRVRIWSYNNINSPLVDSGEHEFQISCNYYDCTSRPFVDSLSVYTMGCPCVNTVQYQSEYVIGYGGTGETLAHASIYSAWKTPS
jgi:hypothetical protein